MFPGARGMFKSVAHTSAPVAAAGGSATHPPEPSTAALCRGLRPFVLRRTAPTQGSTQQGLRIALLRAQAPARIRGRRCNGATRLRASKATPPSCRAAEAHQRGVRAPRRRDVGTDVREACPRHSGAQGALRQRSAGGARRQHRLAGGPAGIRRSRCCRRRRATLPSRKSACSPLLHDHTGLPAQQFRSSRASSHPSADLTHAARRHERHHWHLLR